MGFRACTYLLLLLRLLLLLVRECLRLLDLRFYTSIFIILVPYRTVPYNHLSSHLRYYEYTSTSIRIYIHQSSSASTYILHIPPYILPTATNIQTLHPHHHSLTHHKSTGTFQTYPNQSAQNSLAETAASNAKKTIDEKTFLPMKRYSSLISRKKRQKGRIWKCSLPSLGNW